MTKKSDTTSWNLNPKFILKLNTKEPILVKITLLRAAKAWKHQMERNTMGTMLGFYVFPGGQKPTA
jgi:hypothetical protein